MSSTSVKKTTLIYCTVLFFAAFILYTNTLGHSYALDDAIVITKNSFTKKGKNGIGKILSTDSFTGFFGEEKDLVEGGRYRPLSIITFAIEYEFFGLSPKVSHFFNILLYAITCVLLFIVLKKIFDEYGSPFAQTLPFIISLLYCFHPLHTEVVANIKGRDEILSLLGALVAFYFTLKYVASSKKIHLIWASLAMFFGLMSKENAITFCAIIPIALIFFKKIPVKKTIPVLISLLIPSVIFIIIREAVLDGPERAGEITEILNNPFAGASLLNKYATIFYTWLLYIKLLVFPHPLTYDYYPNHIEITSFSNPLVIISLLFHLALIVYALIYTVFIFTKKPIKTIHKYLVFSVVLYFATFSVVSNLFFSIGVFMAERFMYLPSIAFSIALGIGIYELVKNNEPVKANKSALILASFILLGYSFKTISRNNAWENDFVLFTTDVKTSYNSAKVTCSAGGKIMEEIDDWPESPKKKKMYADAKKYLNRSVQIHPKYVEALNLSGNCCYHMQQYDSAVYYYKKVIDYSPAYINAYTNMLATIEKIDNKGFILETLHYFHKKNPNVYGINYKLGHLYGSYKNDIEKAIYYLSRAVAIDKTKSEAWKDLGVAYGFSNNLDEALKMFLKAYSLNPNDDQLATNIATTYLNMGKYKEAENMLMVLHKKKPKDAQILMRLVNTYQKMGNNTLALKYYKQAQSLQLSNDKK